MSDIRALFKKALAPRAFQFEGETYYAKRLASLAALGSDSVEGETASETITRRLNAITLACACDTDGALLFDSANAEHVAFVLDELPLGLKSALAEAAMGREIDPNAGSTPTRGDSVA